ncbi:MAG: peptidylprolyl isomerase [Pseudomonadota bacterium]|nr:peptidylprolyl isomerase [Pseudomonadota bacterium]
MFLTWMLVGCKDAEMEAQNAKLTQRVADLERTRDRLEKDNEALKARIQRGQDEEEAGKKREAVEKLGLKDGQKLTATFQTTLGDIECTLRPEEAPATVANFVELARGERTWTDPNNGKETNRPLYDGTIFHRVIPGFMIQGGDPLGNGTGDPGYKFEDEVGDFTVFDKPGLLAMANSGKDTNGSQFFITEGTPDHLNRKHTIFGDCQNLDVVAKIARTPAHDDKPDKDVVIKKITISAK